MDEPPKSTQSRAVEDEWKRAASAGRMRTLQNVLVGVLCVVVMGFVAVFFFMGGSLTYAVLSMSMGVVFFIWAASGKLLQGLRSLVGIRR